MGTSCVSTLSLLAFGPLLPQLSIILLCMYQFILIIVLLNMLITLLADVYQK